MFLKSYVDKDIILEGLDLSFKANLHELMITAPSVVSHSSVVTNVASETFINSTTKIQDLLEGIRMYEFEIGQYPRFYELYSSNDSSPRPIPKLRLSKENDSNWTSLTFLPPKDEAK